jgi:hypothetical protein
MMRTTVLNPMTVSSSRFKSANVAGKRCTEVMLGCTSRWQGSCSVSLSRAMESHCNSEDIRRGHTLLMGGQAV